MKEYFKYSNGYININDENVFLTNSGNWSETPNLLEKSPKSIRKNKVKGFKIYIYLLMVAAIVLALIVKSKKGILPIAFIGLGIGAFSYMKRERGNQYKIPISKIKEISTTENSAKIIFLNALNEDDFEIINGLEPKGLSFLEELIREKN